MCACICVCGVCVLVERFECRCCICVCVCVYALYIRMILPTHWYTLLISWKLFTLRLFSEPPVEVSSKQWIGLQMKFILWLHVCAKRGWNSHYIHVLLDWLWKIFMHYWLTFEQYLCAFMQVYSCNIGTLSTPHEHDPGDPAVVKLWPIRSDCSILRQ